MKIKLLDSMVFNRIAAGEVVEKPASIVKELVENSIDAKATVISIEIEDGGKKKIVISDNGQGIEKDDLNNAFMPHATSKISKVEDLDTIHTLGFRGEALASIASVCHIYASSKTENDEVGHSIRIDGGLFSEVNEVARNKGTTIEASDLFYNAPVRAKFLRRSKIEESEITHLVEKFMLAHPEISFLYVVDGKQIYNTISSELSDIIYTIYGKEVYDNLIKIDAEEDGMRLSGFIISPKYSKVNRTNQTLFVNGRYVENYLVSSAVQGAFEPFLMKGRFPIYILSLTMPSDTVDVNIHPTKREVKFENPNRVFGFVRRQIENGLIMANHIANFEVRVNSIENETLESDTRAPENTQSFAHVPVADIEPLPSKEGMSYRDNGPDEKIAYPKREVEIETKTVKQPLPDFMNITIEKTVPVNKIGGRIFFDQTESVHASEIEAGKMLENKFLTASVKDEMKILGTLFATYIVVEYADKAYFIDQHAAHERTLYDKLCKQVENSEVLKQPLLFPFELKTTEKERIKLIETVPVLEKLGFNLKESKLGFEISAVPLILSGIDLSKFFESVLADESIFDKSTSQIMKERLSQYACKHAIKAGDHISNDEIAYLIDAMRKGVLLCPHGRPIVLELEKRDFEKMFKRVL
ncbi:MAG TPA: DNA mismatch repair endonuclease MutL [Clostridiales bacterium]|nr:DNA mismatch repair endonuclease MutL [Clostridiales bacterium]